MTTQEIGARIEEEEEEIGSSSRRCHLTMAKVSITTRRRRRSK